MPIFAAEVTCDVVQAALGLAVAVVAAYVTIRTRAMDARMGRGERRDRRCRRRARRLHARVEQLEAERDKKPLDKRTRRG